MNPTLYCAREILRRLRWLERAESLLHALRHPEVPDADVDAVARALEQQVQIERAQLYAAPRGGAFA